MPRRRAPTAMVRLTKPTESVAYPTFWRFAAERQRIYRRRVATAPPPWTDDPILAEYKFTNVFRASDRVSQHLVRLIYDGTSRNAGDLFLRVLLFKIFNKVETWRWLEHDRLDISVAGFDVSVFDASLNRMRMTGKSIYSGAYIMPSGGAGSKHLMHLRLLARMVQDRLAEKLESTRSLRDAYELLLAYPTFGPFLAFQYAIDLNYSPLMNHDEGEFVVAGPGALDGLSKCFTSPGEYSPSDIIHLLAERQNDEFARFGLTFDDLWGRPMQPIDVQNVFCEVSKYTRVSHPELAGASGRVRIKQRFSSHGAMPDPFFPPKWKLQLDQGLRKPQTKSTGPLFDHGLSGAT